MPFETDVVNHLKSIADSLRGIRSEIKMIRNPPVQQLAEVPVVEPQERMQVGSPGAVMRDAYGPLHIRYELPYGHGTLIYSRNEGEVVPNGFDVILESIEGKFTDFIPVKRELDLSRMEIQERE